MGSHLLLTSAFCLLAMLIGGHADSPIEVYWKRVLGNTAMPNAVKESLPQYANAVVDNGEKFVPLSDVYMGWSFAVKEVELHDDIVRSSFFLKKDLQVGKKRTLHFPLNKIITFLPRPIAESVPFSSSKLPQILSHFKVNPQSKEAQHIRGTIRRCEVKSPIDREKYCATSLESLVDYVTSKLGNEVKALSPLIPKKNKMQYTILDVTMLGDKHPVMTCHKTNYPFAVFYCHLHSAIIPYRVSLIATDGTKVKVLATCHNHTSQWNPKAAGFQVLNVKPGATICHSLGEHDVLWLQN
ncbi:hypothetical protein Ancab_036000 [Ancistrocladus abbreviatus]